MLVGIADAENLSTKAMKTRKKLFGQEHNKTLRSMTLLGLAYQLGGRLKEAEELQAQVLETRSRVPGAEHPSTISSMDNLASIYGNQGRWKEAEELGLHLRPKVRMSNNSRSSCDDMALIAIFQIYLALPVGI